MIGSCPGWPMLATQIKRVPQLRDMFRDSGQMPSGNGLQYRVCVKHHDWPRSVLQIDVDNRRPENRGNRARDQIAEEHKPARVINVGPAHGRERCRVVELPLLLAAEGETQAARSTSRITGKPASVARFSFGIEVLAVAAMSDIPGPVGAS